LVCSAIIDNRSQKTLKCGKNVSDTLVFPKIVQEKATNEKFILEEAQRKGHRERREAGVEWIPKLFERDPAAPNAINRWLYKYRE